MKLVEYYSDNTYTKEYYLTQYVLTAVFIRKKYCVMLLTDTECNLLKESMPDLTINYLRPTADSTYSVYELYA